MIDKYTTSCSTPETACFAVSRAAQFSHLAYVLRVGAVLDAGTEMTGQLKVKLMASLFKETENLLKDALSDVQSW